jgi:hypothetical protein
MKTLRLPVAVASFVLLALAAACGSSDGTDTPATVDPSGTSGGTSGTSGTPGTTPAPLTIFTIVMENHDYAEIVGKTTDAPFINSLIDDYGLATNYNDSGTHPSLPNYLVMVSGYKQYPGILDVDPTSGIAGFPKDVENLGTQLEAAKIPWRAYQESMGTPCKLAGDGDYAPKHDPFLYFTDMQTKTPGLCDKNNVDYTEFPADLAKGTYRYMWITPNLVSDGHNPTNDPVAALKASDTWAKTAIEAIMASAVYKANGIIFLTWDEAEGRSGPGSKEKVPMIVISPNLKSKGFKTANPYSHKSYLATVEDLLKLPRLATVTSEPSMLEFFK